MRLVRWGIALALAGAPVLAQAAAGNVLFALGRVEIQRGSQVVLAQRGTAVEVGDLITTGPTGMGQVRMKDGALLSLRYGSQMKVEDFKMPAPAPAVVPGASVSSAPVSGGGGRSVLRLLRGAFRTVTGLIGKGAGDSYSLITPVATIGIRGTDYSVAYCSGNCGATPDGLYVGVSNGEIVMNNDAGSLVLSNDQYGYVKDSGTQPNQEVAPPEVLETPIAPKEGDKSESSEGTEEPAPAASSEGGSTSGGSSAAPAPADNSFTESSGTTGGTDSGSSGTGSTPPHTEFELLPAAPGSYAYGATVMRGSSDNGVYTDSNDNFTGFLGNVFNSIGTAQNVNVGADAGTGLRWGRWAGGVATSGDNSITFAPTNDSLHWIYAYSPSTPALPTTGTASYTLIGNTDPTDSAGRIGQLGDAQFTANFTTQTVTSSLNLQINNQVWLASGTGSIGGTLFSGNYAVLVNDAAGNPLDTSGTGNFNGFFTNGGAGAGLSFNLTGSTGSTNATVSGVAGFANTGP